jgi:hypothetical protein
VSKKIEQASGLRLIKALQQSKKVLSVITNSVKDRAGTETGTIGQHFASH